MNQKRASNAASAAESPESVITPSWEWPWWRTTWKHAPVFLWILAIHITAVVGLILFPLPGWRIFLGAIALAWIGGLGTTICYHRALAHRALELNPWASAILTFFAVFNGSGVPISWVVRHRLHHAKADTIEDISSPVYHGFWWAHLRWLWQTDAPPVERYCRDLNLSALRTWDFLEGPIVGLSFFFGLYFGACAFFWLGAIRLVFALHAQCFVNSICHTEPGIVPGEDSSRNIGWLAVMHFFQGENWHRNHHSRPGLARLGWTWRQPDVGYLIILLLEKIGVAAQVRDFRRV